MHKGKRVGAPSEQAPRQKRLRLARHELCRANFAQEIYNSLPQLIRPKVFFIFLLSCHNVEVKIIISKKIPLYNLHK